MLAAFLFILHFFAWWRGVSAFPDAGKWQFSLGDGTSDLSVMKSLYAGSQVFIEIICKAEPPDSKVIIDWSISESVCWNDHPDGEYNENASKAVRNTMKCSVSSLFWDVTGRSCRDSIRWSGSDWRWKEDLGSDEDASSIKSPRSNATVIAQEITTNCSGHIMLNEMKLVSGKGPPNPSTFLTGEPGVGEGTLKEQSPAQNPGKSHSSNGDSTPPFFEVPKDGYYILSLRMRGVHFGADVHVDIMGENGYLSAADWPLLPFYGIMCLVYVFFGVVWLIVSFCQWRELLRIQFWIGGVILLGMLEKATFYAEYQNINSTGVNVKALVLLAEWVSCAKRTLARMLVVIVSLGFGIVKPRLGSMLHRLICVGACYFILAVVESYIRVVHPKNRPSNELLIASIPLAVLDSAICWWIFTALIQTTRTLRLRRNLVKLSLYRHFMNTLVFAVLASVIFILYSIKVRHLVPCVTDWKNIWVDEAYWHILFSVLLLVIMILWRPTNNNQRYAFTPLLDAAEDDEEEEDLFVNDAYGVKMRSHSRPNSPKPKTSTDEDILKWVDENIPSAGVETALPIFDSEEEILTTKYEVSKMQ